MLFILLLQATASGKVQRVTKLADDLEKVNTCFSTEYLQWWHHCGLTQSINPLQAY